MPLTGFEFAIAVAIIIGLPVGVVMLNMWRSRAGGWLLGALVTFILLGNAVEKLATGTSTIF
jgi:hypothetical protein